MSPKYVYSTVTMFVRIQMDQLYGYDAWLHNSFTLFLTIMYGQYTNEVVYEYTRYHNIIVTRYHNIIVTFLLLLSYQYFWYTFWYTKYNIRFVDITNIW